MADIIRLKTWKTYLTDGKSSVSYSCDPNGQVAVAIIVGYEPARLTRREDEVAVDDIVLDMARHIKRKRKERSK